MIVYLNSLELNIIREETLLFILKMEDKIAILEKNCNIIFFTILYCLYFSRLIMLDLYVMASENMFNKLYDEFYILRSSYVQSIPL